MKIILAKLLFVSTATHRLEALYLTIMGFVIMGFYPSVDFFQRRFHYKLKLILSTTIAFYFVYRKLFGWYQPQKSYIMFVSEEIQIQGRWILTWHFPVLCGFRLICGNIVVKACLRESYVNQRQIFLWFIDAVTMDEYVTHSVAATLSYIAIASVCVNDFTCCFATHSFFVGDAV